MSTEKARRHHERSPYTGIVLISWEDDRGTIKYGRVKCRDIGGGGLQIESPVAIPVRTRVALRGERLLIDGSATVRHVVRTGVKFMIGLELTNTVSEQILESARQRDAR